ncbi:MAG: YdeI/OmpD-associated family protein [Gemmatimonadales bacterium]
MRANKEAWSYFKGEAPWYQRTSTFWVMSAKRDETRRKRLETLLSCSAKGLRVPPLRRP